MKYRTHWTLVALLALTLCAAPALADDVIYSGIDVWVTAPSGSSFVDFANRPLPSGFFCPGSETFDGKIHFVGAPLATEPPGALGVGDTVIHRLDDAPFDKTGVAQTRIQVRALSMVSLQPVSTACGAFEVRAVLDGEQPITTMEIHREHPDGGTFFAPLKLRTKMLFRPVDQPEATPLELQREVSLAPAPDSQWSFREPELRRAAGFVVADTDGDHKPDFSLPGHSNFAANRAAAGAATLTPVACEVEASLLSSGTEQESFEQLAVGGTTECCIETCHCSEGAVDPLTPCDGCEHLHCVIRKVRCDFVPNECATGPFCCPTSTTSL